MSLKKKKKKQDKFAQWVRVVFSVLCFNEYKYMETFMVHS